MSAYYFPIQCSRLKELFISFCNAHLLSDFSKKVIKLVTIKTKLKKRDQKKLQEQKLKGIEQSKRTEIKPCHTYHSLHAAAKYHHAEDNELQPAETNLNIVRILMYSKHIQGKNNKWELTEMTSFSSNMFLMLSSSTAVRRL